MKTEKQVADKLEKIVDEFNIFVEALPEKERTEEMLPENQVLCASYLISLGMLAFVLDCEEELEPLKRMVKLQAIANKFKEKA